MWTSATYLNNFSKLILIYISKPEINYALLFAVDGVFTAKHSFAPVEMQLGELVGAVQTSAGNGRQVRN
jgi:hypothetical protein